jgi:hypothetical protein
VIARRANPDVGGSLDRARRDKRIVSVAPGVYCVAGWQDDPWVRLRAAALWAGPTRSSLGSPPPNRRSGNPYRADGSCLRCPGTMLVDAPAFLSSSGGSTPGSAFVVAA